MIWADIDKSVGDALHDLMKIGAIAFKPVSAMIWMTDKFVLRLPIANSDRAYASLRWLPCHIVSNVTSSAPPLAHLLH